MKAPQPDAAARAPDLASLAPLITAIVTALAAWKLFEPKFARIRAIRTEMGFLEPAFRWLYVLPQWLLALLLWGLAAFLLLTFLLSFQANWFAGQAFVQRLTVSDNVIWVIFSSGIIAAVIYWNVLTVLLLWITRLFSLLLWPVRGLGDRFGPRGSSPGWHQARIVCEGPDKGNPLLIDYQELNRVGWLLVAKLAKNEDSRDLAAEPVGTASEKANLAMFGCMLEAEHYANGWRQPPWSQFYAALGDVQRANGMFSPQKLVSYGSGKEYFEELRTRLIKALQGRGVEPPADDALAAAETISTAWARLGQEAGGDVLALVLPLARKLGLELYCLNWRLRTFPRLDGDGMRTQLLKLLLRWNTLPGVRRKSFGQPFAKRQAWLLLEENVLRTLPEAKEVTFFGTAEVAIARIASRALVRKVAALVRSGETKEARTARARLGSDDWDLNEETDFILWQWAGSRISSAEAADWKDDWHWKFKNGRVSKLG